MLTQDTRDNVMVEIPLGEIRRLRDELARHRNVNNILYHLWGQIAGLYQRLDSKVIETAQEHRRTEHGTSSTS